MPQPSFQNRALWPKIFQEATGARIVADAERLLDFYPDRARIRRFWLLIPLPET